MNSNKKKIKNDKLLTCGVFIGGVSSIREALTQFCQTLGRQLSCLTICIPHTSCK